MSNNYEKNFDSEIYTNSQGEFQNEKKPIYKKNCIITIMLLAIIALIIIVILTAISNSEKIDWSSLELGTALPEPEKAQGEIIKDSTDYLAVEISKVTKEYAKDYKNACIKNGYTIDSEESENNYEAFNDRGYELQLLYYSNDKKLKIRLSAPEELGPFEWPTSGIGATLPAMKSNLGRIGWNNSTEFIACVGNTTIYEYNEYVKKCEDIGFTIDRSKSDKFYSAKNKEGSKLVLMYLGANNIEIAIKAIGK